MIYVSHIIDRINFTREYRYDCRIGIRATHEKHMSFTDDSMTTPISETDKKEVNTFLTYPRVATDLV